MAKRVVKRNTSPAVEFPDMLLVWEHDGITYNRRDPIHISGESGKFLFWYADVTRTGKETVTVWWIGRHFRSFYADRVISPDQAKKKKEPVCQEHPTYGAVRRPRTECGVCWAAFEAKQEKKHGKV